MADITPLFGRILIKPLKKQQTSSLIYTPEVVYNDRGAVIESGDSTILSAGDVVIFNMRYARFIRVDDEDIMSVDEKDIMAIMKEN